MYEVKLDRNNTSFSLQLFEFFKKATWTSEYEFMKYYQNLTRMFATAIDIDSRGLLVQYEMGMGKSILAIAIAIDMMKEREPIILLAKSLQENMRSAIHKYINLRKSHEPDYHLGRLSHDEIDQWISDNFSFVSMNASNMLNQMSSAAEGSAAKELDNILDKKIGEILKLPTLDGKLLIVDEAHNLFRAITNGSKNALALYDAIMKSKNLKIMFFTGTPISNHPFELVPCFNMLGSRHGQITLPENYDDFVQYFVDAENNTIKNKDKFQNRILGLVSCVTHSTEPGKAIGADVGRADVNFPEVKPLIVERVHMCPRQYVIYQLARDKENSEQGGGGGFRKFKVVETPSMTKPKSGMTSTYRVKSRQLSNYCPASDGQTELHPKFTRAYEIIEKHNNQIGLFYSQFTGDGGLGSFAKFLNSKGWKEVKLTTTGDIIGGSEDDIIEQHLKQLKQRPIGNEWWLEDIKNGGDEFKLTEVSAATSDSTSFTLQDMLVDKNTIIGGNESAKPRDHYYAIISGEVTPETRSRLQEMFNRADNMHGGIIDLILVSSTGAEGLDLKHIRHIHILEPYWTWARVKQIIARGGRNGSHTDMSPEEQNVTPYLYLAVPPETEKLHTGLYPPTTDTELYDRSIEGQTLTDAFNQALKEVSVECMINGENSCYTCAPTDRPLTTKNIAHDIKSQNPCTAIEEKQVKAQEITIDDTKYYYLADPENIYDYAVFEYDKKIDGFRPMAESNPLYSVIAEAINSKSNRESQK